MWHHISKQSPTAMLTTHKSINMCVCTVAGPWEAHLDAMQPLLTLLLTPVSDYFHTGSKVLSEDGAKI